MSTKLFFLLLFLHITAWLALKPVWPFSDDYWYAFQAHNFSEGSVNLTYNQFQNRVGVYFPTSLLYYFFKTNPYTIALWPLIASCLTISVVFLFLERTTNSTIALISTFLIAVNTTQITYSIALFPDLIVALFCITTIFLLNYGRQNQKIIYPVLLNISFLLGFFTKETIVLIVPFILLVLFYDLSKKQNSLFWKRTISLGLCSALLHFLIYFSLTGDAFFRFRSLLDFNNKFMSSEVSAYIKSSYSSNIFTWLNGELGYFFILIFALFTFFKAKERPKNDLYFFITIYTFVLLAEFIIMFHTEKYGMLFSVDRLWIITIAPLSILSAFHITRGKNEFYFYLMLVFFILCLYNFYATSFNRSVLFGSFLLASQLSFYLKQKNKNWRYLLLVPFLILATHFIYNNTNYRFATLSSGNIIKEQLDEINISSNSEKKIIYTDKDLAENHIVYNDFKEYPNLLFQPFDKYDSLEQATDLYVIVNTEEVKIPDFILNSSKKWEKKYDAGKLLIYKKSE